MSKAYTARQLQPGNASTLPNPTNYWCKVHGRSIPTETSTGMYSHPVMPASKAKNLLPSLTMPHQFSKDYTVLKCATLGGTRYKAGLPKACLGLQDFFRSMQDKTRSTAGLRGTGRKEKEWTDSLKRNVPAFSISGDWKTVSARRDCLIGWLARSSVFCPCN